MELPKNADEILLNELTGSNDWENISAKFKFEFDDLVKFKNLIDWYYFLNDNKLSDINIICKLLDNNIIDLNQVDKPTIELLVQKIGYDSELLSKYKDILPIGKALKEIKFANSEIGKIMGIPEIGTDITINYGSYLRPYKIIGTNKNKFKLFLKPYTMIKKEDFNIYYNQNYDYILDSNEEMTLIIRKNGIYALSRYDELSVIFRTKLCHINPIEYLNNRSIYNFIKESD